MRWGPDPGRVLPLYLLLAGCAARSPSTPQAPATMQALPAPELVHEAKATLERAAGDLEPSLRGRALTALITGVDSKSGGPWLPRALWDPNPGVQRGATRLLGDNLDDPSQVAALLAYLGRPELAASNRCLAALPLFAAAPAGVDPQARAAIDAALGQSSPDGPSQACLLAAAQGGDPEATARLLDGLGRGRLRLDLDLVLALARTPVPGVGEALARGLDRVDELAMGSAGLILLAQGHAEGERVLRRALTGPDPVAAMEVVDLLVTLGGEPARRLLQNAVGACPDPRVDLYVRLASSAFGSPDARVLRELSGSDDGELVSLALSTLNLGLERQPGNAELRRAARRTLRSQAGSDRPEVQVAMATLIGRLGETDGIELLPPWQDTEAPLRLQIAGAETVLVLDRAARRAAGPSAP